jgi:hypothetical protein
MPQWNSGTSFLLVMKEGILIHMIELEGSEGEAPLRY